MAVNSKMQSGTSMAHFGKSPPKTKPAPTRHINNLTIQKGDFKKPNNQKNPQQQH